MNEIGNLKYLTVDKIYEEINALNEKEKQLRKALSFRMKEDRYLESLLDELMSKLDYVPEKDEDFSGEFTLKKGEKKYIYISKDEAIIDLLHHIGPFDEGTLFDECSSYVEDIENPAIRNMYDLYSFVHDSKLDINEMMDAVYQYNMGDTSNIAFAQGKELLEEAKEKDSDLSLLQRFFESDLIYEHKPFDIRNPKFVAGKKYIQQAEEKGQGLMGVVSIDESDRVFYYTIDNDKIIPMASKEQLKNYLIHNDDYKLKILKGEI